MTFCAAVQATVLCLLLAAPSAVAAEQAAPAVDALISYSAPMRRVLLTSDFRIVDTEEFAEYADPVSATPSKVVTVAKSTHVAPAEAAELLRLIRESGFHALKGSYGVGPKERSYPCAIAVRDGKQEKQVLYRSSPMAEPKPKAFAAAEGRIIEFARKALEINSGEQ